MQLGVLHFYLLNLATLDIRSGRTNPAIALLSLSSPHRLQSSPAMVCTSLLTSLSAHHKGMQGFCGPELQR